MTYLIEEIFNETFVEIQLRYYFFQRHSVCVLENNVLHKG